MLEIGFYSIEISSSSSKNFPIIIGVNMQTIPIIEFQLKSVVKGIITRYIPQIASANCSIFFFQKTKKKPNKQFQLDRTLMYSVFYSFRRYNSETNLIFFQLIQFRLIFYKS